jgi:hypothetical protein
LRPAEPLSDISARWLVALITPGLKPCLPPVSTWL